MYSTLYGQQTIVATERLYMHAQFPVLDRYTVMLFSLIPSPIYKWDSDSGMGLRLSQVWDSDSVRNGTQTQSGMGLRLRNQSVSGNIPYSDKFS